MNRSRSIALMLATGLWLAGVAPLAAQQATLRPEIVSLKLEDGDSARAFYYSPDRQPRLRQSFSDGGPQVGFVVMHPRGDGLHFLLEPLARDGFATLGVAARTPGRTGVHEELVLNVAAGVQFLKSRGVRHVVLAGHSGGGSLMAFYQAQAETGPPNRVKHTPAGDPPNLNEFDMPWADGLVTLNAHEGEGHHRIHILDPSVVDEHDPFSYDPSVDIYNPDNGFREPPEETRYKPEFLERVAKAQQKRAERLVELAQAYVREENSYRGLMKQPGFKDLDVKTRLMIERRAHFERPFIVYRHRHDPRLYDLSLDPSDRVPGHYRTGKDDVKNGFKRTDFTNWEFGEDVMLALTPRTFLSTISILSNANFWENLKKVSVPLLVINSSADPGIHPSEARKTYEVAASKDKERVWILGGDHGFLPEGPKAGKGDQRQQVVKAIAEWARKRWPAGSTSSAR